MKLENKILKLSAIGALFFALFGIAWGWAIKSDMIIFDGLYSFISVILSMLSLYINNYMAKRDFESSIFTHENQTDLFSGAENKLSLHWLTISVSMRSLNVIFLFPLCVTVPEWLSPPLRGITTNESLIMTKNSEIIFSTSRN